MKVAGRSSLLSASALSLGLAVFLAPGEAKALMALEQEQLEGGGGGGGYYPAPTSTTESMYVFNASQGMTRPAATGLVTVYIHGRSMSYGSDNGTEYWTQGKDYSAAGRGPNPVAIRWDGTDWLQNSQAKIARDLDTLCGAYNGPNPGQPCQIVCHSTGCLLIGKLAAENTGRWNVTTVYALAGAQGGTPGADTMIAIDRGAASWGARIGTYFGGIWGGIVGALAGEALAWLTQKFTGPVTGVIYDLQVSRARALYNHEVGPSTKTVTSDRHRPKKKCRWYQLGCHLSNVGIGLKNGFFMLTLGNGNDGIVPVSSSASFRYVDRSRRSTCPASGGTWSNHWSAQSCSNGIAETEHMELNREITAAGIYTPPPPPTGGLWDDCPEWQTEGTCNSYDDYLDTTISGYDGAPINARCGGYDLGTENYYYGSDCNSVRYYGTTGDGTAYTSDTQTKQLMVSEVAY